MMPGLRGGDSSGNALLVVAVAAVGFAGCHAIGASLSTIGGGVVDGAKWATVGPADRPGEVAIVEDSSMVASTVHWPAKHGPRTVRVERCSPARMNLDDPGTGCQVITYHGVQPGGAIETQVGDVVTVDGIRGRAIVRSYSAAADLARQVFSARAGDNSVERIEP